MIIKNYKYYFYILLIFFMISPVIAGVYLDNTRIIYRESDFKVGKTIQVISNQTSDTPYIIKAQVMSSLKVNHRSTPFIVIPSFFRLEPGNANQIRILMKSHLLVKDRESLFYFQIIAVPSSDPLRIKDSESLGGILQLASANIIKLLYRPNDLSISPEKAMAELQFSSTQKGIKIDNPTPYYMTLDSLTVNDKVINIRINPGENIISPFSSTIFSYEKVQGKVQWKLINDYGGVETFNGSIK